MGQIVLTESYYLQSENGKAMRGKTMLYNTSENIRGRPYS